MQQSKVNKNIVRERKSTQRESNRWRGMFKAEKSKRISCMLVVFPLMKLIHNGFIIYSTTTTKRFTILTNLKRNGPWQRRVKEFLACWWKGMVNGREE